MYGLSEWQRLLSYAGVICMIILILKLCITGLARTYFWFTCFLWLQTMISFSALHIRNNPNLYATLWVCSKPLQWVLTLAVLLEIYSLVMARYPGIATLLRWAVITAATVAFTLSLLSLSLDFQNPNERFPLLRYAFAVQRTMDATLALSLLLPWLLITWFRITLCRNVVVHWLLFSASVALEAGTLLARNILGPDSNPLTSLVLTAGNALCIVARIFFLTRKGELAGEIKRVQRNPEAENRLIGQLAAVNKALLRAVPSPGR